MAFVQVTLNIYGLFRGKAVIFFILFAKKGRQSRERCVNIL